MSAKLNIFPETAITADYQLLYQKVAAQIEKDFQPHAILPRIPEHIGPDWLYDEVKKILTFIIEKQNQSLGAILYRVDIPEKMVKSSMGFTSDKDKIDKLTMLILRREAQKVWIRHHYSQ